MNTIYERIRELRQDLKWSQETLAKKVGYADKTAIAKIEAGKVDIPQSKLIAFANALNTTTIYLLEGEEQDVPHTIAAHLDTSDLTDAELEDVASYIAFIKGKRK